MLASPLVRRIAALLLATCAAAALPTSARADDRVTGSGRVSTETRATTGFEAIALRGSMSLVLRQGTRAAIELHADDSLLPLIETRVVDHGGVPTLEIAVKAGHRVSTLHEMTATVDVVTLRALAVTGSGDTFGDALKTGALAVELSGSGALKLTRLAADEVSVSVKGSGDVELGGRAARLAVSIAGSGDVNTRALEAADVSVAVSGSGDADVNARQTLAVSIAGSGEVVYTGEPAVKSSVAGSGRITHR